MLKIAVGFFVVLSVTFIVGMLKFLIDNYEWVPVLILCSVGAGIFYGIGSFVLRVFQ